MDGKAQEDDTFPRRLKFFEGERNTHGIGAGYDGFEVVGGGVWGSGKGGEVIQVVVCECVRGSLRKGEPGDICDSVEYFCARAPPKRKGEIYVPLFVEKHTQQLPVVHMHRQLGVGTFEVYFPSRVLGPLFTSSSRMEARLQ